MVSVFLRARGRSWDDVQAPITGGRAIVATWWISAALHRARHAPIADRFWQRCFFQTPSPQRKLILSGLVRSENLPKISVLGEFIACLEDEFPEDFCRNYLISALNVQASNWTRAALLVAGKHLIDQEILDETAASLLDLPSNDIQRLAADLLFT